MERYDFTVSQIWKTFTSPQRAELRLSASPASRRKLKSNFPNNLNLSLHCALDGTTEQTEVVEISMECVNKAIWHLLHHWNRQFISLPPPTLKHNKRLHNAQFINHTARTIAEHKHFLSRLWGFAVFTQNNMFNMFSVYVFPPSFFHSYHHYESFALSTPPTWWCLRFVWEEKFFGVLRDCRWCCCVNSFMQRISRFEQIFSLPETSVVDGKHRNV